MNENELRALLGRLAREREEGFHELRNPSGATGEEATLSDEARARIVGRLVLMTRPEPAAEQVARARAAPRGAGRGLWLAGTAALVSVVILGAVLWPAPDVAPELPGYRIVVSEGERRVRGARAENTNITVRWDARIVVTLTPARSVPSPPRVHAYLARDGQVRPWEVTPHVTEGGAVRILGKAGELLPPEPGPWDVIAILAPNNSPPLVDAELVAIATKTREAPAGWRVLRMSIAIEPKPE